MNKNFMLGVALGVIFGSSVTYLIMSRLSCKNCTCSCEDCEEEIEDSEDDEQEAESSPRDYIQNSRIVNYKGYYKMGEIEEIPKPEYPTEEEIAETDDDYVEEEEFNYELDESPSEGAREQPYMITADEYNNGALYFDKETLYYYESDDTLTDEYDDIFEDRDKFVGDFTNGFDEDEADRCYVRNEVIGCDYEIVRREGAYYEEG